MRYWLTSIVVQLYSIPAIMLFSYLLFNICAQFPYVASNFWKTITCSHYVPMDSGCLFLKRCLFSDITLNYMHQGKPSVWWIDLGLGVQFPIDLFLPSSSTSEKYGKERPYQYHIKTNLVQEMMHEKMQTPLTVPIFPSISLRKTGVHVHILDILDILFKVQLQSDCTEVKVITK